MSYIVYDRISGEYDRIKGETFEDALSKYQYSTENLVYVGEEEDY